MLIFCSGESIDFGKFYYSGNLDQYGYFFQYRVSGDCVFSGDSGLSCDSCKSSRSGESGDSGDNGESGMCAKSGDSCKYGEFHDFVEYCKTTDFLWNLGSWWIL